MWATSEFQSSRGNERINGNRGSGRHGREWSELGSRDIDGKTREGEGAGAKESSPEGERLGKRESIEATSLFQILRYRGELLKRSFQVFHNLIAERRLPFYFFSGNCMTASAMHSHLPLRSIQVSTQA